MEDFLKKYNAPPGAEEKFLEYEELLLEWNKKFNLTAVTDRGEIKIKHFEDSVAACCLLPREADVLDIGSGAGLPGIPLKIVRPDIRLTMIDSVNKKVTFLNEAIKELKLENTSAEHARAEELDKKRKYDVVVSRAVAKLSTLAEYALPFLKQEGIFIAYKSEKAQEEISDAENALILLKGEVKKVIDVSGPAGVRKLIVIGKYGETPEKYPRGRNLPRLKPL
jgi:16S rRNA methyltransferase gidB